jgi:hypothetical protein
MLDDRSAHIHAHQRLCHAVFALSGLAEVGSASTSDSGGTALAVEPACIYCHVAAHLQGDLKVTGSGDQVGKNAVDSRSLLNGRSRTQDSQ